MEKTVIPPPTSHLPENRPVRCMHIIGDLDIGGAEMMLCKLITSSDHQRFRHQVVSLLPPGPLCKPLLDSRIDIFSLQMHRRAVDFSALPRLAKLIRKQKPDVIQTWMYYSDIIGGLAARLAGSTPVINGIRHGCFAGDRLKTLVSARIAALLSHFIPSRIVACSTVARQNHLRLGYPASKTIVIPNGFNTAIDVQQEAAGQWLRQHLGIAPSSRPIGMVGRFDPVKGHQDFISAAAIVKNEVPAVEFVLCGSGVDQHNSTLTSMLSKVGLSNCVHLLGNRNDITQIIAGFTFLVSSSITEAFANVIGEAMACGVPCVVTDVGDSAHIVGDTGIIVPPCNPQALAHGMLKMLAASPIELMAAGKNARERVKALFSLPEIVKRFEKLYLDVIND